MAFCFPEAGLFGGNAICAPMKEHLMLFWLAEQKQITEGAVAHAINDDTEAALKQIRIFAKVVLSFIAS